ncbi:hypothetical protein IWX90DRAFT_415009 [Phyllosticta citrichinensis]|uniref:Uncharacterized protein n=1 Tax=Phyllosticta citrichinensis TaxID=1130410 RepID=A0ABR1XTU8_9PEZI
MADAIGIVTEIIEFIKIGKKDLEQQQQLTETIQFFEGQAEAFKANTAQNNNPIFPRDRKLIDQIIKRCVKQQNDLERHLNGITGQLDGSRSQRAWAAVCALRKDSQSQDSFDRLQLDLTKLSSMFLQQSFVLLQNQRQLKIHDKVESLEATIMNLSTHTQIATTRLIDDAIDRDMSMMKLGHQELTWCYANEANTKKTQMALSQRPTTSNSVPEFPGFAAFHLQDHIQSAAQCKCKSRPKTLFWSLGLLNSHDKRDHQSDCPLFGTSEREVNVALRLAVPFIFEKSIQFVFNASWGAGGVALSPAVKLTVMAVDRSQSPAFIPYSGEDLSLSMSKTRTALPYSGPTVTKYASRVIKMMVGGYGADPNTIISSSSKNDPKKTNYENHSLMDLILMRTTVEIQVGEKSAEVVPIEAILNNHGSAPFKLSSKYFASEGYSGCSFGHIVRLFNSLDLAQGMQAVPLTSHQSRL